jgi:23S rRNA (uridine2552-2'-O)-methyltransferase
MAKSKSSRRWLAEHFQDQWVKQAQQSGLRSRSAYKLIEIQKKDGLIRAGQCVVDLGSAPGGWCQVALPLIGARGKLVALDILPMDPIDGVTFIEGDFTEDEALAELETSLNGRRPELVMSDMAPNMSGMRAVDQPRAMYLAELALSFAEEWLEPGGNFLVKIFHGEGSDDYLRQLRILFDTVKIRKPDASRPRSREVYFLGRGRKLL